MTGGCGASAGRLLSDNLDTRRGNLFSDATSHDGGAGGNLLRLFCWWRFAGTGGVGCVCPFGEAGLKYLIASDTRSQHCRLTQGL